ncbi:MAG: complex I subunit 5 family protein [Candidatus Onthomonas sp.]
MLPLYQNLPLCSIVACMLAGIFTSLCKKGKTALRIQMALLAAVAAASLYTLICVTCSGVSFEYQIGIVGHPWGNELRCGPLEAGLALAFTLVMALCVLGGLEDLFTDIHPGKQPLYFVMCDLLLASLLAMVYTNDLFTAYVFIEINTIASCALVMAKDTGATVAATLRYLIMSLLGSGLFLFGLAMLYWITGHLLIPNVHDALLVLQESGAYAVPLPIILGMMVVGLSIKSALYPFHTWLPDAHGSATTTSSAILSGLVLKGYIVLMIKLIWQVCTPELFQALHLNTVLLLLGALAMIMGSVNAIRETHIKRMIAYSSVAQIGYIYLGLGLGTQAAAVVAVYQILVHAFTKPLLFCCAGELAGASHHHKHLYFLRGSAHRARLAGFGFTLGGLSMVGIPLLGGFAVKFYLADAALSGTWQMVLALGALAASSVLNALYYLPVIINIWSKELHGDPDPLPGLPEKPARPAFAVAVAGLSAGAIALGIFLQPVADFLSAGLALL